MLSSFKATRPLEYVCLFQMDFPTKKEGDVFMFLAVDVFSHVLFSTGAEKSRSNANIIKHTKLLLADEKFKGALARQGSFTLVFHKFEAILPELCALVAPLNGNAIISDPFVTTVFTPVMKNLFEYLSRKK